MFKKFLAALGTLALAAGLSVVAVASPVAAHTGDLNATAVCNPLTGNYDVTYKLTISNTSLAGSTYWRTGTTSFEGTPTSNTGLTNGPVASTGAGTYTLGTISVAGNSTKAPWAYAYTTWTDNFKKGSDGGDIALGGNCSIPEVPVAVLLTYMQDCPVDTTNTWRVRNPSAANIAISWHNASNTLSGTHTATPGDTFFTTPRGSETMIISWGGGSTGVVAGSATKAAGNDLSATDPACFTPDPKDATGTITFTPPTCDADGSYTLSGAVNATFTVFDGTTTTTGLGNTSATPAVTGKTYTITVVPGLGHGLTDATDPSESFPFTAAINCRLEVALYVYKKLNPALPAAWDNSGKQTLITSKVGNTWYTSASFPTLPSWVCGPAWGVQQDMTRDWAASWDADSNGRFDWPLHIQFPDDNIGWPPLYDAQHADLSTYLDVPACKTTSGVPTYESKSCAVDSQNLLTLPVVDGGEWEVTKGGNTTTYASYNGGPTDGFGNYTIVLVDADPDDEFTVTPTQASWTWTAVDPGTLKCATAEDPNWSDQECNPTGPGTTTASYTVFPATGVRYEVSLDDGLTWADATPPGNAPVVHNVTTFPTKVIIRAFPLPGYELLGTSQSDHRFIEAEDCIDNDATAFIETVPPTCAAAGSINSATLKLVNASWTAPLPNTAGNHDVTAQADAGHAFAGGVLTLSFPLTIGAKLPAGVLPCDLPSLAPVYPRVSSTPLTCTAAGSYTIGALTAGTVKWSVNGGPLIDGGTFPVTATTTISLVASPTNPLDTLATDDLDDPTWTNPVVLKFTKPATEDCGPQLTTLALTGAASTVGLSLAGGLVLLGFGGLLMFARNRRPATTRRH